MSRHRREPGDSADTCVVEDRDARNGALTHVDATRRGWARKRRVSERECSHRVGPGRKQDVEAAITCGAHVAWLGVWPDAADAQHRYERARVAAGLWRHSLDRARRRHEHAAGESRRSCSCARAPARCEAEDYAREHPRSRHPVTVAPPPAMSPNPGQLARIAELVAAGDVHVEIAAALPLREVRRAHEMSESGHSRGKIILVTDS
jgi:hypothetical protein